MAAPRAEDQPGERREPVILSIGFIHWIMDNLRNGTVFTEGNCPSKSVPGVYPVGSLLSDIGHRDSLFCCIFCIQ